MTRDPSREMLVVDRRTLATVGARAVGGGIGIGVAAFAVAGATLLPIPTFAVDAPASTVRPVPADQQLVCPGPVLALAADAGRATRPSALGEASTDYGTDGFDTQTRLLKPDADTTSSQQGPLALSVSTPAGADRQPLFGGAQAQTVASPDTAGLAAASCSEPSAESWLVAGSTALGQTSLILLANPTSVDATVNLALYSETGTVDAPGATGIVVPAGAQRVVPLAGLAPSARATVVHVTTTSGEVTATMQQSFVQGIQPRGVELAGPTAPPARTQIVSGMTIATLAAVTAGQSAEGVNVEFPVVRILVPGDQDAEVTIGAVGEAGTQAGNSYAQSIKAGSVAEVPLDHLKDGSYTVTVHSSVPVVAAVRTSVIGAKTRDFAWFSSSPALGQKQLLVIPEGPGTVLHAANPGEEDAQITVTPVSGAPVALKVPAEGGANRALKPGRYVLTGTEGLTLSVSLSADGAASTYPLSPPGPLAAPIEVYPR